GECGRDRAPSASGGASNPVIARRGWVSAPGPLALVAVPELVVDPPVTAQPARPLAMRVGAAHRVDLGGIRWIAGEFEDHAVRRHRIARFTIAVLVLAEFPTRRI